MDFFSNFLDFFRFFFEMFGGIFLGEFLGGISWKEFFGRNSYIVKFSQAIGIDFGFWRALGNANLNARTEPYTANLSSAEGLVSDGVTLQTFKHGKPLI